MANADDFIGENIRAWREKRGLTQKDLAKLAGLTDLTIHRLEKGRQPRQMNLRAIAIALGVSVLELKAAPISSLTDDENHLLSLYREGDDLAKEGIISLAERLVPAAARSTTKKD